MNEPIQIARRIANATSNCKADRAKVVFQVRSNRPEQVCVYLAESSPDQATFKSEKASRIGTCLLYGKIIAPNNEQRAVRLDRCCEMNLFPLTVREIRLPKSRSLKLAGSHEARSIGSLAAVGNLLA